MRLLRRSIVLLLAVALVASSCGDDGTGGTSGSNPATTTTTEGVATTAAPNPASIDLTTDQATAASETIGPLGGTVEATGADGTRFTLTVPEGALLSDVEITMTPIASASGEAIGDTFFAGVSLEPDGLHFTKTATLEISSDRVPADAVGLGSSDGGQDLHLTSVDAEEGSALLPVIHFSEYMVAASQVLSLQQDYTPSGAQQVVQEAIAEAEAGDLSLDAAFGALELWGRVIRTATAGSTGTEALETRTGEVMSWFLLFARLIESFDLTANSSLVQQLIPMAQSLIDTWFAAVDTEVERLAGKCAEGAAEAGFLVMRWVYLGLALDLALDLERDDTFDSWKDAVTECFSFQVSYTGIAEVSQPGVSASTKITSKATGVWPGEGTPGFVDSWLMGFFGLYEDDLRPVPITNSIDEIDFFGLACTASDGVVELGFNLEVTVPNVGNYGTNLGESEITGMIAGVKTALPSEVSCPGEPDPGATGQFFYDYFEQANEDRLNASGLAVFTLDLMREGIVLSAETTDTKTLPGTPSSVDITQTIEVTSAAGS